MRRTLSQAALLLLLALGAEGELAAATGPMEAAEREERNSHLRFMPGEVISRELMKPAKRLRVILTFSEKNPILPQ